MSNQTLQRAADFLVAHQGEDGYWRDYRVGPNGSRAEAWITACVGYTLTQIGSIRSFQPEIEKAANVLLATRRADGWGYNRHTACDADTTAWVVRFLASIDALEGIDVVGTLGHYVTADGRVKTFQTANRFGRWAHEHDEVAPMVGMALLSSGQYDWTQRIRQNVAAAPRWRPFWWRSYAYVCAQSLEFLAMSGGIADDVSHRETAILGRLEPPSSSFDVATRMIASRHLGTNSDPTELTAMQASDGSWQPSIELLVPDQWQNITAEPQADDQRLMSTSMAMLALANVWPWNRG